MNRIHTTRFCSRTVAKACTAAALLTGVMTMTGCMVASDTWYARVEEETGAIMIPAACLLTFPVPAAWTTATP